MAKSSSELPFTCTGGCIHDAQATMDATEELASLASRYTGRDLNIRMLEETSMKYEPPTMVDDDGQKVCSYAERFCLLRCSELT